MCRAKFEITLAEEPTFPGDLDRALARMPLPELQYRLIRAALAANDGNRERTAQALGISPRTLYRRLRELRESAS